MAKQQPQTSLEKSHSKKSNAKLTLLSFIASIFITMFWVILAFAPSYSQQPVYYFVLIADAVIVFFLLVAFSKFTR